MCAKPSSRTPFDAIAPDQGARVLMAAYGESAAAEALLRGFLCERGGDRAAVAFWLAVHGLIAVASPSAAAAPDR